MVSIKISYSFINRLRFSGAMFIIPMLFYFLDYTKVSEEIQMVISTKIGYNKVAGSLRCSEADYTIPVNIDRKDADDIERMGFLL